MEANQNNETRPANQTHPASCHCGAVRFEVTFDASQGGSRCNCSVCTKLSAFGQSVKPDQFRLLQGKEALSSYQCASKVSTRYFCKHCGVHCYGAGHLAELGGDFVSFNLSTLDDVDPSTLKVVYWDGRHNNWQAGTRETPWPVNP